MNKLLGTNNIFGETYATAKVRGIIKPTLVFLLIFFVGSMINGAIVTVPTMVYMFTSAEFWDIVQSGATDPNAIMDFSMNMPSWLTAITLFATVGSTIAAMLYCTKFENRRLFTYGFTKKNAVKEYIAGLVVGLIMFTAVFGIILVSGQGEFKGFNANASFFAIILLFCGFLVQGMSEEVLVRSYYFTTMGATKNMTLAVFISSVAFAALHLANPGINFLSLFNLTLFGIFAAVYYLRRGNIWGISAIHSIWNFAQGNIFGFKVSGSNAGDSIFTTEYAGSGTLFNGGDFGPEGGLGVTIVLVIGIIVVLFMKNKEVEGSEY